MRRPLGAIETAPLGVGTFDSVKTSLSYSASTAVSINVKFSPSFLKISKGDVMTGGVLMNVLLTKATAYRPTSALSRHVSGPWQT